MIISSKSFDKDKVTAKDVPISTYPVGSSIFIDIDGTPHEFLVVHHGNPDESIYDSSCEGTWLLMKDVYEQRAYSEGTRENRFGRASIYNYLNETFLSLFPTYIQAAIKTVDIPCVTSITSATKYTVANVSTNIFLLSKLEVGYYDSTSNYAVGLSDTSEGTESSEESEDTEESETATVYLDGSKLDYFLYVNDFSFYRASTLNGNPCCWYLRTPFYYAKGMYDRNVVCRNFGEFGYTNSNTTTIVNNYDSAIVGIRPALILLSDTLINTYTNRIVEVN